MSRLLLIVSLVVVGLLSASWAGDDRSKAIETKHVASDDEARILVNDPDHGPTHPAGVAVKERIARLSADAAPTTVINPKGLLVVLSKQKVNATETVNATLKDARIRSLGGRSFVVGLEVEGPKITRPSFVGKMVWIPLDDVIQLIEVEDSKAK